MKWLLVLCAAVALAGCGDAVSATAPTDSGATAETTGTGGNLSAALAEAKETGRKVLVIYGSKDCPYSRRMEAQTLTDPDVKAAMEKFVVLRIEKGVNSSEFEAAHGVRPTPTVVTLDAGGEPVGTIMGGVMARSDFLAYAAWAETGEGTQPNLRLGGG